MPKTSIPATAEGMPKFNRKSIMQEAWGLYRRQTNQGRALHAKDRRRQFVRCLVTAWAWARQRIADALKTPEQKAAERLAALKLELMRIDAMSFRYSIEKDRKAVLAEIDNLSRIAA